MLLTADSHVDAFDAGELGCSALLVALRSRVDALPPGGLLRVVARDWGAAVDVPAWCWSTGHELVDEAPPLFVIRRRTASA